MHTTRLAHQPPLVRRLPDLDPKARHCVAAIALLTLAACGGSEEPLDGVKTIQPVSCAASGVCS